MLVVTDLKKSFLSPEGERVEIVHVPSFALAPGEQLALRGESGSGKTTFLNLIAGILAADSGSVVLDGTELTSLSEPKRDRLRADKLGYIFQTFNLLQGYTVIENVLLGMSFGPRGADRAHAREVLERVGLNHRLHHFPRQLSTGQQQRGGGGPGARQPAEARAGRRTDGQPRPQTRSGGARAHPRGLPRTGGGVAAGVARRGSSRAVRNAAGFRGYQWCGDALVAELRDQSVASPDF